MKVSRRIMAMLLVVLLAGNCLSSVQAAPKETQPASENATEVTNEKETSTATEVSSEPKMSEEEKSDNEAEGKRSQIYCLSVHAYFHEA